MSKRYRGNSRLAQVQPENRPGYSLKVHLQPGDVHLFIAIMEGYAHLAFPVNVNPKAGLILLFTTPELFEELEKVINHCPLPVTKD